MIATKTFLLTSCLLLPSWGQGAVPLSDFFPFGVSIGDSRLPPNDDDFANVSLSLLPQGFKFLNTSYSNIFVNNNGGVSFRNGVSQGTPECGPSTIPMIAPFWADVDTRDGGSVFYRETVDPRTLRQAQEEVDNAFPTLDELGGLRWAFVATWHAVPFYGASSNCSNATNTFQLTLTTDGLYTYAIFYYSRISWTTGGVSGGDRCTGLGGGIPAQAGFDAGDEQTFYILPSACTPVIINITQTSNVNSPGKWVFRIETNVRSDGFCNTRRWDEINASPSFVPIMGHTPVALTGTCREGYQNATCTFVDLARITYVPAFASMQQGEIHCVVPYLYTNGRILVVLFIQYELSNGTKGYREYWTYIFTQPPSDKDLMFELNETSRGFVMQWNKARFITGNLQLGIAEYTGHEWKDRADLLADSLPNTGSYNGGPLRLNLSTPLAFYLQEQSVAQKLNGGRSPPIRLYSKLLPGYGVPADVADAGCDLWYRADPGVQLIDILPCPPTVELAKLDQRFERDRLESYRQKHPSPAGAGSRCNYRNASIYINPSEAGRADLVTPHSAKGTIGHFLADVTPFNFCCKWSSGGLNGFQCAKYFEKRPVHTGAGYRPPTTAGGFGDPHITTFDNYRYTFNGVGEFWLIDTPTFKAQCRMEAFGQNASVFTAFAFLTQYRNGPTNSRLQVSLDKRNSGRLLGIRLDHFEVAINQESHTISLGDATVTISEDKFLAVFSHGFTFSISKFDGVSLNFRATADQSLRGSGMRGLLGDFDGNPGNDLKDLLGTVLPSTATLEQIHTKFGTKWRTTSTSSIFIYSKRQSHASYQNESFHPTFSLPSLNNVPQATRAMCTGSYACLYDYVVTGLANFANATKQFEVTFNETLRVFAKEVKMCPAPVKPENGSLLADNYLFESKVTFDCDSGYVLNGIRVSTCVVGFNGAAQWKDKAPECMKAQQRTAPDMVANFTAWLTSMWQEIWSRIRTVNLRF